MNRTAIVLSETLSRGEAANVAAILMGHASRQKADLYALEGPKDLDGNEHAAVRYNVVALKASPAKILSASGEVQSIPGVYACLFSKRGQQLSNSYDTYVLAVSSNKTVALEPVGLLITGNDATVRQLTKKFSLLRD